MTKSQYSSKDRVFTAIGSGEPDRVPVLTYSNHFQIRQAGYSYGEVMEDGEKFVEAQTAGLGEFEYDGVTGLGGPGMIADALGAKLLIGDDESPSMTKPGLTGESDRVDLDTLHSREVIDGDYVPFTLEVNEKLKEELGPDVPVIASISSPFREACLLRGFEKLFEDIIRDTSFVKELVDLMTGKIYDYADLAVKAGADILGFTDPFASSSMISRPQYRDLIHPSEKEIINRIQANAEAKVLFHTCGEWGDRFDLAVGTGADIYHLDGVGGKSLEEIRSSYPETTIMGRLPTAGLLLNGNSEEVKKAAEVSIEAAGPGGNYVLAGNCSLAPETPSANVKAIVETAKTYGAYTHQNEKVGSEYPKVDPG